MAESTPKAMIGHPQTLADAVAFDTIGILDGRELVVICENLVADGAEDALVIEIAGLPRDSSSFVMHEYVDELVTKGITTRPSSANAILTVARCCIRQRPKDKEGVVLALHDLRALWGSYSPNELTQFVVLLDDWEDAAPQDRDEIIAEAVAAMDSL